MTDDKISAQKSVRSTPLALDPSFSYISSSRDRETTRKEKDHEAGQRKQNRRIKMKEKRSVDE
jgi:hypothetical protein